LTLWPPNHEEAQASERELARSLARRLAIIRHAEEVSGNVARTCRYYGITRQSYYVWLRRYEELGVDGLRDRSTNRVKHPVGSTCFPAERELLLANAGSVERLLGTRSSRGFSDLALVRVRRLHREAKR
jgi:transposase-like protein